MQAISHLRHFMFQSRPEANQSVGRVTTDSVPTINHQIGPVQRLESADDLPRLTQTGFKSAGDSLAVAQIIGRGKPKLWNHLGGCFGCSARNGFAKNPSRGECSEIGHYCFHICSCRTQVVYVFLEINANTTSPNGLLCLTNRTAVWSFMSKNCRSTSRPKNPKTAAAMRSKNTPKK